MYSNLLDTTFRLIHRVPDVVAPFDRLISAVGPSGSGKAEAFADLTATDGRPRINVNLKRTERPLDLAPGPGHRELKNHSTAQPIVINTYEPLMDRAVTTRASML